MNACSVSSVCHFRSQLACDLRRSGFAGRMRPMKWTTWGPVRGMGPIVEAREDAERSLRADVFGCARQGGYSDREVFEVDEEGFLHDAEGDYVWPSHGRSLGAVRVRP